MQVVADPQRVRHRRQRRVHRARRREEARVDDVEVVERRAPGSSTSSAEVAGSSPKRTVPHWCATPASGMRWSSTDAARDRALLAAELAEQALELGEQPPVRLDRCGTVLARWMRPWRSTVTRLSGCGQVLGREPEVDRVLGHVVEREARGEPRRARPQDVAVALAEHLDVPERVARSRRRPSSSR